MAVKRPCIECGALTHGSRCSLHEGPRGNPHRPSRQRPSYAEQKRRKEAVELHIKRFGYVCFGWGRGEHPATDLTADHVVPRAHGGEHGPLQVLCRSCNSRRGEHPDPIGPR